MRHRPILFGSCASAWALGMFLLTMSSAADSSVQPDDFQSDDARIARLPAETGIASYYADKYHGRKTASGETFDMHALTAAHPTYPFGTRVKVTHLESRRSVIVRINDRGPFVKGRVIDLSLAAAEQLRMVRSGLAQVKLEILE